MWSMFLIYVETLLPPPGLFGSSIWIMLQPPSLQRLWTISGPHLCASQQTKNVLHWNQVSSTVWCEGFWTCLLSPCATTAVCCCHPILNTGKCRESHYPVLIPRFLKGMSETQSFLLFISTSIIPSILGCCPWGRAQGVYLVTQPYPLALPPFLFLSLTVPEWLFKPYLLAHSSSDSPFPEDGYQLTYLLLGEVTVIMKTTKSSHLLFGNIIQVEM